MPFENWIKALGRHLSLTGLAVGAVFFALSLTPSLLPRSVLIQGILSGCIFAVGYAIGVSLQWVWEYLELPPPRGQVGRWFKIIVGAFCLLLVVISLFMTTEWQNSVRSVMGIEMVEAGHPLQLLLIAVVPAAFFMLIGTLLVHGVRLVFRQLVKVIPPRAALVGSLVIVAVLTSMLFSGVLLRGALHAADSFFKGLDGLAGQFGDPPTNPTRSGSAASLVDWTTIGRDGRIYVESGPTREQIETQLGRPALDPLRVYVGLRSAPTTEARAALALEEMLRVGAFDRSVLLVIMPVGTGWVDPPGIDTIEYLLAGDVASVALQYSYLTSPLSLLVEPDYGIDAAQALFQVVYDYWTKLPKETRPQLYLNGLSLGAHTSQASTQFFDILPDPIDGALWVGPPFSSSVWRWATVSRQPDSPEWLPRVGNELSIRFTNSGADLPVEGKEWGPLRIAFLQNPSDPITFFSFSSFYRTPDWMVGERGPGVAPTLGWYPVITFLQLAMDMALAQAAPAGYGHLYSHAQYIDAWLALIEPPGWDEASIAALKASFVDPAPPGKPL